jgi:beta-glucosidase
LLLLGGKPGKGGAQANSATFALERIGLPELRMADGPMGVHWWCDASTAYPALIAAAACWDPELWYRLGTALGRDCRARGVHILLAPGVNIYRGPWCGRNFEYAGEDPYLSSRFAVAYIRGVQDQGVAATVKHFAVNYAEYGRHTVSSDLDARTLHEIYLPAFKAAVSEGGSGALMTAYNLVNGVHCSEHPGLILEILKGEWQFDGVVMSDWLSTYSVAEAANAGLDLEMPSAEMFTKENLSAALAQGEVASATIDDKVRRILRLAVCFGWLDHEQKERAFPSRTRAAAEWRSSSRAPAACCSRTTPDACRSIRARVKTIAVLGPYAAPAVFRRRRQLVHPAARRRQPAARHQELCPEAEVLHAAGPDPNPQHGVFAASVFSSAHGRGALGRVLDNGNLQGAPVATRLDEHIDFAWGFARPRRALQVARFRSAGRGAPAHSQRQAPVSHALARQRVPCLAGWSPRDRQRERGEERATSRGRRARRRVASMRSRSSIRKTRFFSGMQFGWQWSDGGAKEIARMPGAGPQSGRGDRHRRLGPRERGRGFRSRLRHEPGGEALLLAVAAAQPKTIVVLTAGGNLDMNRFIDRVPAVLHAFYPGEAGGQALAEILSGGSIRAAGCPPRSRKRVEDRSCFGSYFDSDGDQRVVLEDGIFTGYRHFDRTGIEPRFAFGFGLSYTTFRHSGLRLSRERLSAGQSLELSLDVSNTGSRAGAEVVQVYVRDVACRLPRPEKELKGFARVLLEPGESKRATVVIKQDALEYYDPEQRRWLLEPGEFEVLVGASATDIRQTARFVVA